MNTGWEDGEAAEQFEQLRSEALAKTRRLKRVRRRPHPVLTGVGVFLALYSGLHWALWHVFMVPMVNSLAFSSDGRTLAAGGTWGAAHGGHVHQGVICLWDTRSGNLKQRIWMGDNGVRSVCFSPDGQTLASVDNRANCTLWDPVTGAQQRGALQPLLAPQSHSSAFEMAWFINQRSLTNWMQASNKLRTMEQRALGHGSWAVALSPDGSAFVSLDESPDGEHYQLRLRAMADGGIKHELVSVDGGRPKGKAVSFSRDGKMVAAGSDESVTLWDAGSGTLLKSFKPSTLIAMNSLIFSPDNRMLALGDYYGPVELWDWSGSKLLQSWTLN